MISHIHSGSEGLKGLEIMTTQQQCTFVTTPRPIRHTGQDVLSYIDSDATYLIFVVA